MAHEYPPIGEHVGMRAASPAGEIGTRAESAHRVTPAGASLLRDIANTAFDDAAGEPGDLVRRIAISSTAALSLRALADALEKITPLQVHLLDRYFQMACTCGVVTADDRTDWDAAVARLPELIDALRALNPASLGG